MTPTKDIFTAFASLLETAFPSLQISWPGADFTPPDSGTWLEAQIFPNEPIHDGIALDDHRTEVGILQVAVMTRPSPRGFMATADTVEAVKAELPIGHVLTGPVRVYQEPSEFRAESQEPARLMTVVSVGYRG